MSDDASGAEPEDSSGLSPEIPTAFGVPADERRFEDYEPGAVYDFQQRITVEPEALVDFARQFDPQSLHTDPELAASGPHGGLIASGWHTAAIMMRLFVDQYCATAAGLGGPAADELRWLHPVRPGDQLRLRTTVLTARRSQSKPDRGVVRILCEVENQRDLIVFTATIVCIVATRDRPVTAAVRA